MMSEAQVLKWKSTIYSKASNTNLSSGRFELALQEDGNLVLYPVERVYRGAYWSSGQLVGEASLEFDMGGLLYLVNTTNNMTLITKGEAGNGRFLLRATESLHNMCGTWTAIILLGHLYGSL
ncbi:hypothetical protein SUGI_1122510 [Cryptomeria japonica]|nr:hypothetical protein SUGI_1122510 [Cryptomeria japonica]